MCGIGGILRVWPPDQRELALRTPHAQSIPEAWLDILDNAVKHRGPDGQGRFRDRALRADGCVVDVAFVHRRLSIIDHAGGHQPMILEVPKGALSASSGSSRPIPGRLLSAEELQSHNRRVLAEAHASAAANSPDPELALRALSSHDRIAVVFNGCIYNHRGLRAELQHAGHVFSTDHSDTEALVHGWRQWRDQSLDRLDGMFSLAVWDSEKGELVLARDNFGEKPLYRAGDSTGSGVVAFASTAAALARLPIPFMTFGDTATCTAPWIKFGWNQAIMPVPGVGEVIAGCSEAHPSRPTFPDGTAGPRLPMNWWAEVLNPSNEPLLREKAEHHIRAAVESRLESDVPTGCFLSGGIDSGLIAAIAKQLRPDVQAFTVRMPDAGYDESAIAAAIAKHIGIRHTILDCQSSPTDDLACLVPQLGLPFGDSSLLPTTWVSRAAKSHLGVALSGDGGDEMFLGYDRHRAIRWLSRIARLPRPVLAAAAQRLPLGAGDRHSKRDRLARLVHAAAGDGYKELVAIFPPPLDECLGIAGPAGRLLGEHWGLTRAGRDRELTSLVALRFDRLFYLPCDLMRKSDTSSMSVALEVRSPMLARELARAAINAPISSLTPHNQRKGLLRQIARKYLPAEIVDRPKMGFAIPIGEWFRSDYGGLRTMLLDHLNSTEPFGPPSLGIDLNMKFIRQMLDEHLGTGPSGRIVRDHSQRLYMLLVLSIWAKWLGGLQSGGRTGVQA